MMIKLVKLITSEEIIADLEEKDGKYKLKNPVRIVLSHDGNAAMVPFSPFLAGDSIEVEPQNVLFQGELEQEVYNAYNSKFGSGIVMPSLKLHTDK